MEVNPTEPARLVFGPAEFAGYDAVVLDAATAERWARASRASTWAEFANLMYGQTWEEYSADDEVEYAPDDEFDFGEWLGEAWYVGPLEIAHDTAAGRVAELIAEHPAVLMDVHLGGGSPGGNIEAIDGPIEQLTIIASLIDPALDGFILERDDALVDAGMARHLYS